MHRNTVPVKVGPCSLLSRKPQMNSRANIEPKEPRLFSDIVPSQNQATRHIWNSRFFCESISMRFWANIAQVIFLCTVVSGIFRQHWLDNIPRQYCSSMVNTIFYMLSSLWKLYLNHGATFHRQFPYAMLAQIGPDKVGDYFSVQNCLWTVAQHYTGKFLVQYWLRQIKATLHMVIFLRRDGYVV